MYKAGTDPKVITLDKLYDYNDWSFPNTLAGIMLGSFTLFGAPVVFMEVSIILGILCLIPILAWLSFNAYAYSKTHTGNHKINCDCRHHYSFYDDERPSCETITGDWNKLNEDNQGVTLPLVEFVYKYNHSLDTFGKPLYASECKARQKAVKDLLEEQRKLEYCKPELDNSDVLMVQEYITAMRGAREILYPESMKAVEPPKPLTVVQQRQERLNYIKSRVASRLDSRR